MCVPDLALHSDLANLSRFAGGEAEGNFDPWTSIQNRPTDQCAGRDTNDSL